VTLVANLISSSSPSAAGQPAALGAAEKFCVSGWKQTIAPENGANRLRRGASDGLPLKPALAIGGEILRLD
jgi:hypothetical protein